MFNKNIKSLKCIKILLCFILLISVNNCFKKLTIYEKWQKYPSKRYKLLSTLINDKSLINLPYSDIINLFGEPYEKYINDNIIVYKCGRKGFTSFYLAVEFKDNYSIKIWSDDNFVKRKFSKQEWKNNKENRIEIVDDLLNSIKLVGLNSDKIISILGEPDHKELNYYEYYLGPGYTSRFSPDPDWLILTFNDNNVVIEYSIINR